MKVQLTNLQKKIAIDEAELKRMARKILSYIGKNKVELGIVLTDDYKIRLLNKKFRKVDQSTDVLTFCMREGEDSDINPTLLGDIVISVETASRCAKRFKVPKEEEIYRYLTHGILHLLGHNDKNMRERREMRKREEEIIKYLNRYQKPESSNQKNSGIWYRISGYL